MAKLCTTTEIFGKTRPFPGKLKLRRLLPPLQGSLFPEGLTVGTLIHGGVLLVGAHQNAIQRAVVLGVAVVSALLYGAFNALVGMTIHGQFLLFVWCRSSMDIFTRNYSIVAFWKFLWYDEGIFFGGLDHGYSRFQS